MTDQITAGRDTAHTRVPHLARLQCLVPDHNTQASALLDGQCMTKVFISKLLEKHYLAPLVAVNVPGRLFSTLCNIVLANGRSSRKATRCKKRVTCRKYDVLCKRLKYKKKVLLIQSVQMEQVTQCACLKQLHLAPHCKPMHGQHKKVLQCCQGSQ